VNHAATTDTFGDSPSASARLRGLAELYEPETRDLIDRRAVITPVLAVDLGCGPGYSTRLLHERTGARQTVGCDVSARFLAEARRKRRPGLMYLRHDVTRAPFPAGSPDLLLCRFLLTHLAQPELVLATWAHVARPGACLLIHETETLESTHPALRRYYELVDAMQAHDGQALRIGATLQRLLGQTRWTILESRARPLRKPAAVMAALHAANLVTWRRDPSVRASVGRRELDRLAVALGRIAEGTDRCHPVLNVVRQIVAVRR